MRPAPIPGRSRPGGPRTEFEFKRRGGWSLRDRACGCAAAPVEQDSHPPPHSARKTKRAARALSIFLAERGGFEPPVRYHRTLAFQASTLNHSATSPFYLPGTLRGGIDSGLRPSPVKRALAHFVHCASSRPASPTSARTPGTVSPYTRFPGEHFKPLSHLSVFLLRRRYARGQIETR